MMFHTSMTVFLEMPLDDLYEYNTIAEEIIAEMNKPKPGT